MTTESKPRASAADIARYRDNLRDEVDGAALYRLLARAEPDPHLAGIYEKIAGSEDRHRELWETRLREAGEPIPDFKPSFRIRFMGWCARRFGTRAVAPFVSAMEARATGIYDAQPEAIEAGLPRDERSHARLFREISHGGRPAAESVSIAKVEGRHRYATSGNALRAAVLGMNDGLVSNFLLVMGFAGANPGRAVVFLAGVSGLLAGAISMALGEWISVRSSAEAFNRQLAIEREELEYMPEEEEAELTLIYQAKGFSEEEARAFAHTVLSNKETALDTLVREELGMSADETGDPWTAAVASFILFTLGALVPLLPWMFVGGGIAIALSAILAGAALFASGSFITLFTGRGAIFSGMRQLVFGMFAAVVTFGIGALADQFLNVRVSSG